MCFVRWIWVFSLLLLRTTLCFLPLHEGHLHSKSGIYLKMLENGSASGCFNRSDPFSLWHIGMIKSTLVTLTNVKTGQYLCVDRRGRTVGLKTETKTAIFELRPATKKFWRKYACIYRISAFGKHIVFKAIWRVTKSMRRPPYLSISRSGKFKLSEPNKRRAQFKFIDKNQKV